MTATARDFSRLHIHSLPQGKLEEGIKRLSRVLYCLAVMGEQDTEHEVMEVVGLEMDEAFWRRIGRK